MFRLPDGIASLFAGSTKAYRMIHRKAKPLIVLRGTFLSYPCPLPLPSHFPKLCFASTTLPRPGRDYAGQPGLVEVICDWR